MAKITTGGRLKTSKQRPPLVCFITLYSGFRKFKPNDHGGRILDLFKDKSCKSFCKHSTSYVKICEKCPAKDSVNPKRDSRPSLCS